MDADAVDDDILDICFRMPPTRPRVLADSRLVASRERLVRELSE